MEESSEMEVVTLRRIYVKYSFFYLTRISAESRTSFISLHTGRYRFKKCSMLNDLKLEEVLLITTNKQSRLHDFM